MFRHSVILAAILSTCLGHGFFRIRYARAFSLVGSQRHVYNRGYLPRYSGRYASYEVVNNQIDEHPSRMLLQSKASAIILKSSREA